MILFAADSLLQTFSRVNLESALGVIGGTMGLFTGFSVLSAVEIVYYALKYFSRLSTMLK